MATVVSITLTVMGVSYGVTSAVTNNNTRLLASSVVLVAAEAVRKK